MTTTIYLETGEAVQMTDAQRVEYARTGVWPPPVASTPSIPQTNIYNPLPPIYGPSVSPIVTPATPPTITPQPRPPVPVGGVNRVIIQPRPTIPTGGVNKVTIPETGVGGGITWTPTEPSKVLNQLNLQIDDLNQQGVVYDQERTAFNNRWKPYINSNNEFTGGDAQYADYVAQNKALNKKSDQLNQESETLTREQDSVIDKHFIKLKNGELMLRTEYNSLSKGDQIFVNKQGIAALNALFEGRAMPTSSDKAEKAWNDQVSKSLDHLDRPASSLKYEAADYLRIEQRTALQFAITQGLITDMGGSEGDAKHTHKSRWLPDNYAVSDEVANAQWDKFWASLSKEDRLNAAVADASRPRGMEVAKQAGLILMSMVPLVSYGATYLQRKQMTPTQLATSYAMDTLMVLMVFSALGVKGPTIGKVYKTGGEFDKILTTAKNAGRAQEQATEATAALKNMQKLGLLRTEGARPNIATVTKWRGYVQNAVLNSAKADKKFVDALSTFKNISKSDLQLLEQQAKMPGLTQGITDVNKYGNQLKSGWSDFKAKWGDTGATSKFGDPILQKDATQRYLRDYNKLVRLKQNLQDALSRVRQSTREAERLNPALMRSEEKLPMWSQQGRGWRKGPQPLEPRVKPRLNPKVAELTGQANKLKLAIAKVERIDPDIAMGLKARLRTILQKVDTLSGPKLDYWTGRIKRLRIPDDPKDTASAVDKFLKGIGGDEDKAMDSAYQQLLKDVKDAAKKQEEYLRWKAKDIAEGHPWELEKGTKVATKTEVSEKLKPTEAAGQKVKAQSAPKPSGGKAATKIEEKVASKEKAATEKVAATEIDQGEVKFGMKPKEKVKLAAITIPAEIRGRQTYAHIAKQYGNQVMEDAIGKPLDQVSNKFQAQTAADANQQYQNALLASMSTATNVFTKVYNDTGNENEANHQAEIAAQEQTQTQTQVSVAVKTAVADSVKDMFRDNIINKEFPRNKPPGKTFPKRIPLPSDDDLQIERVEGIPSNAGVISYEDGIVSVKISPPYREGTADISFEHLKVHRKGKGSQEATLKVTGGKAPRFIQLSRGVDRVGITRGKRMTHTGQSVQRGPGIMDRQGRVHKQRRGSVI